MLWPLLAGVPALPLVATRDQVSRAGGPVGTLGLGLCVCLAALADPWPVLGVELPLWWVSPGHPGQGCPVWRVAFGSEARAASTALRRRTIVGLDAAEPRVSAQFCAAQGRAFQKMCS